MLCIDSCCNVCSTSIHILFKSTFGLCNASSPSKGSNNTIELVIEQPISRPNIESSESKPSPLPFAQDMGREETESTSAPGFERQAPRVWLSLSGKGCLYSLYTKFSIDWAWAEERG